METIIKFWMLLSCCFGIKELYKESNLSFYRINTIATEQPPLLLLLFLMQFLFAPLLFSALRSVIVSQMYPFIMQKQRRFINRPVQNKMNVFKYISKCVFSFWRHRSNRWWWKVEEAIPSTELKDLFCLLVCLFVHLHRRPYRMKRRHRKKKVIKTAQKPNNAPTEIHFLRTIRKKEEKEGWSKRSVNDDVIRW